MRWVMADVVYLYVRGWSECTWMGFYFLLGTAILVMLTGVTWRLLAGLRDEVRALREELRNGRGGL